MSYQKCPICNGTGLFSNPVLLDAICPTCKGTRIISELNGLPPGYVECFNSNDNSINLNHGSQIYPGDTHLPFD